MLDFFWCGLPCKERQRGCARAKLNRIKDKRFDELDSVEASGVSTLYFVYLLDSIEIEGFGFTWFPISIEEFFENEYKDLLNEQRAC